MSVINAMLRDLDRRHGAQPSPPFGGVTVVVAPRVLPWRAGVFVFIGLAIIAGIYRIAATVNFSRPPVQSVATVTAAPAVIAAPTEIIVPPQAPAVNVEDNAAAITPIATASPEKIAAEKAAVVTAPLQAAKSASTGTNAFAMENSARAEPKLIVENAPRPTIAVIANEKSETVQKQQSQNPTALADAAYGAAMIALHNGARGDAERELQNALSLQTQHLPALNALARIYLEDARTDAARTLLEPALAANPDAPELRQLLARTRLLQGDPASALQLLDARQPAYATHTDYHATAAALEQQLGYYAAAAERYRALLAVDASQATWWLGFALALDNQQRPGEAVDAYRRALALNNLPAAARTFAQQRLRLMESH